MRAIREAGLSKAAALAAVLIGSTLAPGLIQAQQPPGTDDVAVTPAPPGTLPNPKLFVAGDGTPIPIQREYSVEADATQYANVPLAQQPWRYDQRTPTLVHTEERPGHKPVYYFNDVRWKQEDIQVNGQKRERAFFTTCRVDMEKVKAAYFCLKPFAPRLFAGHAAIYLEMDPGGFSNLDGQTAPGFVCSFEAWLHPSQHYSLMGGKGTYHIVYVVSTWRDFLFRSIHLNNSDVKRWKLKLTHDELETLELAIGKTLLADHNDERYSTTKNSCVTAALILIDQALPPAQQMHETWLHGLVTNPYFEIPVLADRLLKGHDLVDGKMEVFKEVPPEN